ncbi:MAG TPA: vitamin B12 dependent-methionine synthase activation domain-containing protein, partial [Trebonia sp.]|nr:vitamin B12 dependent-methionine synthase activation domain-containing protein [Trebonia sp.]
ASAAGTAEQDGPAVSSARSGEISAENPVPEPPFFGTRVVKGVPLAEYGAYLDERATFMGQWGLKPSRKEGGPGYEELVETEGRPRLRMWLERAQTEGLLQAAVVYGYFRCASEGNDLIVLSESGSELERFSFPRQRRDARLCLADFFRPRAAGETDVVAFQLATMGPAVSTATAELFAKNAYREYLELHGLSVQLTEALAEYWHARVRRELSISAADPADLADFFDVRYQGARYSIGYPACPDLADRAKIARLLDPARIGVELSEEMQLHPEQSTDAIVVHHPQAKYFSVLARGFDVVVLADGGQQPVGSALANAEPGLRRHLAATPADAVVLDGAAHAVVGDGAGPHADAARPELGGEERAEFRRAAMGGPRADGLAIVPVRREGADDRVRVAGRKRGGEAADRIAGQVRRRAEDGRPDMPSVDREPAEVSAEHHRPVVEGFGDDRYRPRLCLPVPVHVCQQLHRRPPGSDRAGHRVDRRVKLPEQGLAPADKVAQLPVAADLADARVVDDHLAWPHGLQGPEVTVVQRGDVLPHGVGLPRGARLLAGQLHGTGEVRKPRHPPPP